MQMNLHFVQQGCNNGYAVLPSRQSVFYGVGFHTEALRPTENCSGFVADCNGPRSSRKQTSVRGVFWRSYSVLGRPPSTHSLSDKGLVYSNDFSPLSNTPSNSINGNNPVGTGVPVLNRTSCPPAIIRGVPLGVVDAINRVLLGRSFSHVGKKVLVGITPPVTYRNSFSPVPSVSSGTWDSASSNDSFPYSVGVCARKAMRNIVSGVQFLANTTARLCASAKVAANDYDASSAFTGAVPKSNSSYSSMGEADNGKSSKLLSSLVFYRHVRSLVVRMLIIHERAMRIVK